MRWPVGARPCDGLWELGAQDADSEPVFVSICLDAPASKLPPSLPPSLSAVRLAAAAGGRAPPSGRSRGAVVPSRSASPIPARRSKKALSRPWPFLAQKKGEGSTGAARAVIGRASADGPSASTRLPAWVGCLVKTVYGPDKVLAQISTTSPARTLRAQVDPDITGTGTVRDGAYDFRVYASGLATRATRPAPYLSA